MRSCILLVLCLSVARAATPATPYERPINADCVSEIGSINQLDYIVPNAFFLEGTETQSDGFTSVSVTKDFGVQYHPSYKVVSNVQTGEEYLLYQCGTAKPAVNLAGGKTFQIPLTKVAVPDTVPYAFLEILGVVDRVQSVSSYTVSPCAQREVECGHLSIDSFQLSNETALAAVLPSVDAIIATSPVNSSKVLTFSSAQDPGALSRAEWVKFLGLFFNKEAVANAYFAGVQKAYTATKSKAAKEATKPVVAWVQYNSFEPAAFQIDFAEYKVDYTQDGGAQMLDQDAVAATKGVMAASYSPTTFLYSWGAKGTFATQEAAREAFLAAISKADVIVDETYAVDPRDFDFAAFMGTYNLTSGDKADFKWLSGAVPQVFREDGLLSASLGLDWFEGAIAKPDLVLADFYSAFHPTGSVAARPFTWIRHINQAPVVVTSKECTVITKCDQQAAAICPFVKKCPDNSTVSVIDQGACKYDECPVDSAASAVAMTAIMAAAAVAVTLISTMIL